MASQNTKSSSKKPKLVRDSFTIPKAEFAAIDTLKTRAIALGTSVKKSELLRAGLMLLTGLSDGGFKAALAAVPTLKTGRPAAPKAASGKPAKARQPAEVKPAPAKKAAKPAPKASAPKAPARPAAKARPAARKAAASKAPARS